MSEGVEVDVVDALEELGGPGVGQGLGQPVAPGLVLGLQGPELGQGRSPPPRPRRRPGRWDAGVAARAPAFVRSIEPDAKPTPFSRQRARARPGRGQVNLPRANASRQT